MEHPYPNGTEVEMYGQNLTTSEPLQMIVNAVVMKSKLNDVDGLYHYDLQAGSFGDGNTSVTVKIKDVVQSIIIAKE